MGHNNDSTAEKTESRDDFDARMRRRDAERSQRKTERLKKVRIQKILIAVSVVVIATAVICGVVFTRPSVRFSRNLSKGDRYTQMEDYENAQSAYENALLNDASSVTVYRRMADNYLEQGKDVEAKQILFEGWEQTQDEDLLHYYCIEVHNEAVEEVNQGNCTLETMDKFIQVLELEADNEDTLTALLACYDHLFRVVDENTVCRQFFDEDTSQDMCEYQEYEQLLRRLLAVYEESPSNGIKEVIARYALIDMPYVWISLSHVDAYTALLEDVNDIVKDPDITETLSCLARAAEVEDYFHTAFEEFESGEFAYARTLVTDESYQQIRDDFIEGDSGYWEGSIYIPISKEHLVLHREDGGVRFFFPDGEDYENRCGIIIVWGTKQEDDGVQRSAVSYEPVQEEGSYPIEYTVQYLYSNVKINGVYVPQMNYRFDTKVTTEDGITTNAIGDWGGDHEWEIDY